MKEAEDEQVRARLISQVGILDSGQTMPTSSQRQPYSDVATHAISVAADADSSTNDT